MARAQVGPLRGSLLEQPPRRADIPVVLVKLKTGQLFRTCRRQIDWDRPGLAKAEIVDPAVLAVGVVGVVLVAFAAIGPVREIDRAVGSILQFQAPEPGVVRHQKVGLMASNIP